MQVMENSYSFMFKDLKITGDIDLVSNIIVSCNLVRKYDPNTEKYVQKTFSFKI